MKTKAKKTKAKSKTKTPSAQICKARDVGHRSCQCGGNDCGANALP